jgi:hypothetical protein
MKLWKTLASGRSARWAFNEVFRVPNYDDDGIYLTRRRLVQTPWGGIYLHRLDGPDPRHTLHDHPWSFVSIVLRGGYVERRLNPSTMTVDESHYVRRVNRVRAFEAHSIMRLLRYPTWTLLLVGPRVRTWGYLDQQGWCSTWEWTEFDKHRHAAEFDAAMARRRIPAPSSHPWEDQ